MPHVYGELAALRARPIPDLAAARSKRTGFRAYPIALGGVLDREPMVELAEYGIDGENHYHRIDNPPYHIRIPGSIPRLLLRRSVAARLASVDARLRAAGQRLHVYDAYRPMEVQAYFHDHWMPAEIRISKPDLAGERLVAEVERYWSAPTRSAASPAPHATGGAVDLTICRLRTGEPLFMGSIFDDVTEVCQADFFEKGAQPLASYSAREALANRRLLYWVMVEAGFAANPDEWWHFSWGDQMWARLTDAPEAAFGLAVLDERHIER